MSISPYLLVLTTSVAYCQGIIVPPVTLDIPNRSTIATMGSFEITSTGTDQTQFTGPVELNSALWLPCVVDFSSPQLLQMKKSVDNGATWVSQDVPNQPILLGGRTNIALDVIGNVIYILYQHRTGSNTDGLRVISFNTSTGLWSTETVSAPNTDSGTGTTRSFGLHALSANTFHVVYGIEITGSQHIFYIPYSGGAWGSATEIATDITNAIMGGWFVDHDASVDHLSYLQYQIFGVSPLSPNVIKHVTIDSSGTVAAPTTINADYPQSGPGGFFSSYPSFGSGAVSGGKTYLPYKNGQASGVPAVYVFSAGTWTSTDLSTTTVDLIQGKGGGAWTYALASAGTVYVFWGNNFDDDDGNPVRQMRFVTTTDGVTFSSVHTFYDATLNPPPDYAGGSLYATSASVLSSGNLGVAVNIDDNSFFAPRRYFANTLVPPTPTGALGQLILQ